MNYAGILAVLSRQIAALTPSEVRLAYDPEAPPYPAPEEPVISLAALPVATSPADIRYEETEADTLREVVTTERTIRLRLEFFGPRAVDDASRVRRHLQTGQTGIARAAGLHLVPELPEIVIHFTEENARWRITATLTADFTYVDDGGDPREIDYITGASLIVKSETDERVVPF